MAVLNSLEGYKAAHAEVSKRASDLVAENQRLGRQVKELDVARADLEEANDKIAELEGDVANLRAEVVQANRAVESAQSGAAAVKAKADRYDAIRKALA